jgi:hypothetical protein
MAMTLEMVIPIGDAGGELQSTAASLASQTDRDFGVLLSPTGSRRTSAVLDATAQLKADGISARRLAAPPEAGRLEHWNWALSHATADWLKPLLPGERLHPGFVERLRSATNRRPEAQVVCCGVELKVEWGEEKLRAPFTEEQMAAGVILEQLLAGAEWMCALTNIAFRRAAWESMGGLAVHLPSWATLNLNVLLGLHYGMMNLPEPLVSGGPHAKSALNGSPCERVNGWLEYWLMMRQIRNYCLAAKLPWPRAGVAHGLWCRAVHSRNGFTPPAGAA